MELLFNGTGRAAEENPDVVERLNFSDERPEVDRVELNKVIDEYLDYHPTFEKDVRDPITSGNPERVEAGLANMTDTYLTMINEKYGATAEVEVDASNRDACGPGAKVCVAAFGAALVNVAVYANAVLATMAVVALAVVPAYISYLMDDQLGAAEDEIVKREMIAEITRSLAK